MVTNWESSEADMARHERKKLGDRTKVEDWTNGARGESRPPMQDEIPFERSSACWLVTPDRQDQLISAPTPASLPEQASCWTG